MRRIIIIGSAAGLLLAAAAVGTSRAAADPPRCHGARATIIGTHGDDILTGTAGNDVIVGLGGSDTIFGAGGDDVICGGAGHDHLDGGPGDDHLYGGLDGLVVTDGEIDRIGDELRGGAGDDALQPGYDSRAADETFPDSYLFDDAGRGVQVDLAAGTASGRGRDTFPGRAVAVVGSEYGDVIRGTRGSNYLNGGPGPDLIRGLAGDDRLVGDSGRHVANEGDRLYGGPGGDAISADRGEDVLHGGPGDDSMDDTGRSADRMYGDAGDDLVVDEIWNAGTELESGGPGKDHLSLLSNALNPAPADASGSWDMRTGAMTYTLGSTLRATAIGFEDADLATWGTAWTVNGTDGPNYLSAGGSRGTVFRGHGGDDRFVGSPFTDTFDGGPGSDTAVSLGVDPDDTCISVEHHVYDECDIVQPERGVDRQEPAS